MKSLSNADLTHLSLGATLLGSGGGGDPAILSGYLHYLLETHGPVKILSVDDLQEDHLIVPLALIGAPLISLERLPNKKIFITLYESIIQSHPNKKIVLMPAEIGGCNALAPFILATTFSLPVLDADLIGRAFPKINMCKPAILNQKKQKAYLASAMGDCSIFNVDSISQLETMAREKTVQFGGSAAIAVFLFNSAEKNNYIIPHSLSHAIHLGAFFPIHSDNLFCFLNQTGAKIMGTGVITEIHHRIDNGFLIGFAKIKSYQKEIIVYYQNEYLFVKEQQGILAESPDIIALIEIRSGLPLTSESLQYGLNVNILSLPAPDFWQSPEARSQVNLQAFGLSIYNEKLSCTD